MLSAFVRACLWLLLLLLRTRPLSLHPSIHRLAKNLLRTSQFISRATVVTTLLLQRGTLTKTQPPVTALPVSRDEIANRE